MVHSVAVIVLFLNFQLAPLEPVGIFKYFPVPSSKDSANKKVSRTMVDATFCACDDINCKLTLVDWNLLCPITLEIVDFNSSFLNFKITLEGYKISSSFPFSLRISKISSAPVFNSFLLGWLYNVVSDSGNKK